MTRPEREEQEDRQRIEEIREELSQLSRWDQYQVYLYIKWLVLRHKLRRIALHWLLFQLKLDEEIKARTKLR